MASARVARVARRAHAKNPAINAGTDDYVAPVVARGTVPPRISPSALRKLSRETCLPDEAELSDVDSDMRGARLDIEESDARRAGNDPEAGITQSWLVAPLYREFRGSDLPVFVRNTFIDVDEDSPTVRRARRPRSRSEPTAASMAALGLKIKDADLLHSTLDFGQESRAGTTHPSVLANTADPAVQADSAPSPAMPSQLAAQSESDSQPPPTPSEMDVRPIHVASTDHSVDQPPAAPTRAHPGLFLSHACGTTRVQWTVDAKKLRGSDKQVVSPPFDVTLQEGVPAATFKMMIYPKAIASLRAGASFRKSSGVGHVQLKCSSEIHEGPEGAAAHTVSVAVGSGSKFLGLRGPIPHRFTASSVFNLPKEQADWDFTAAVEHPSLTFIILTEICSLP